MTTEGDQPEDIACLFRKFGGDPTTYKEFAPRDEPAADVGVRPLISPFPATAPAPEPVPPSAATARRGLLSRWRRPS
ncbi:hypothetical protein H7F36_04720 [Variovorax sp. PAMC28562]|uniref:BcsR/BcsP family cellulose biosynthesis protein n=1 Tax=Variovorax sp. PAMC28562 TaxID=2762323 RepID=UPI00164D8E07|nr:BcsR/BcsP family cellulose biosynthesis protein [Variovorax sp. PAMC28562]QNK74545.1 hypothetical protein H7F36_04720 [Variovorax sp. PAMC28562]